MCIVTNCFKPIHGNGLCDMHYRRFYRTGSIYINRPTPEERFEKSIDRTNKNGCHLWKGTHYPTGYGIIRIKGKNIITHRFSWELNFGKIPKGLWVLHKCDNPPCVNPKHLFLGTCFDNKRDEVKKGRNVFGEKSPWAKLTNKKVVEIRKKFHNKLFTRKELAILYNISYESIVKIISRESWKQI